MPELIAYASRTGTRRTLTALRLAGWRLLLSAAGVWRTEGFPYALDNGAWSAYVQQRPWDADLFTRCLAAYGAQADWVVVPDIVAGGAASMAHSLHWLPRVLGMASYALLPVQDGMRVAMVQPHLGPRVGLFLGGTTAWKLATLPAWGRLGREHGCLVHVGRVNTARRIRLCQAAGATSFDGSSVSRFVKTLPLLDHARRQGYLFEEVC